MSCRFPLISILILVLSWSASANASVATWNTVDANTARGSIGGIGIHATTTTSAPFLGALEDRFNDTSHCAGWTAAHPLPASATGLTTTYVNAGDSQCFLFESGWEDGLMYIENFDSSSAAKVTVEGGGTVELLTDSGSISYDAATGMLTSANAGYDGEGDAILKFTGAVTKVCLDYEAGNGANGVFYTFATADAIDGGTNVVPEPSSVLVWGGLILAGLLVKRRWATV